MIKAGGLAFLEREFTGVPALCVAEERGENFRAQKILAAGAGRRLGQIDDAR
jgi:hypothetical protein